MLDTKNPDSIAEMEGFVLITLTIIPLAGCGKTLPSCHSERSEESRSEQGSADPRPWGPRFFSRKKPRSQEPGSPLVFGNMYLRKDRGPQRRRSALRSLRLFGQTRRISSPAKWQIWVDTVAECGIVKAWAKSPLRESPTCGAKLLDALRSVLGRPAQVWA